MDMPGVEFTPGPGKKYLFALEVGDLPPAAVMAQLNKAKLMLQEFLPEAAVMVVPSRDGVPALSVYELEEA